MGEDLRVTVVGAPPARARALAAAVVLLAVTSVLVVPRWPFAVVPWNVAVAAVLLWLARRAGVGWAELGLGPGLRRGLAAGRLVAAVVAVAYGVGLAIPATRAALDDSRAAGSVGALLYAALLRIPFGTVALEEVAFRGVIPALVGGSWWRGTLVSSGLFGLWHVVPSLGLSSANAAVGAAFGGWGAPARSRSRWSRPPRRVCCSAHCAAGAGTWRRRWSRTRRPTPWGWSSPGGSPGDGTDARTRGLSPGSFRGATGWSGSDGPA
jgi:hypothetical protein